MNGLISDRIADGHMKPYLKKEPYIRNDPDFRASVIALRDKLGISTTPDRTDKSYREDHWVVEQMTHQKIDDLSLKDINRYYRLFYDGVSKILGEHKLSEAWRNYTEDCVVSKLDPEISRVTFPTAKNIRIEDINADGEVLLRLRPGLKREDYERAWHVISKPLGEAPRLDKSYSNVKRNQQMLQDKESGMTYKEIAKKHYPSQDPELIIETIRKAIYRERKRQEWDK
jgi:hypothetical protein